MRKLNGIIFILVKNYIDAFTLGYLKISYPICFEGVVKSIKEPTDNFKIIQLNFIVLILKV